MGLDHFLGYKTDATIPYFWRLWIQNRSRPLHEKEMVIYNIVKGKLARCEIELVFVTGLVYIIDFK